MFNHMQFELFFKMAHIICLVSSDHLTFSIEFPNGQRKNRANLKQTLPEIRKQA